MVLLRRLAGSHLPAELGGGAEEGGEQLRLGRLQLLLLVQRLLDALHAPSADLVAHVHPLLRRVEAEAEQVAQLADDEDLALLAGHGLRVDLVERARARLLLHLTADEAVGAGRSATKT